MQKLRQEIGNIHEQMVALSNLAKNEQRSFSAEENVKYESLVKDFEEKRNELSRLEAEAEREKYLNQVISPILTENPQDQRQANEEEYMRSFVNYLRNGLIDQNLQRDVLNETTAEKGGVLVPTILQSKIREKLTDLSVIRKIATIQKSSSNQTIPVFDGMGDFSWIDEMATFNEVSANFTKLSIGAYKLGGIIKISEELLSDNILNLESFIVRKAAEKISKAEEDAFIRGDGDKKPTGLINAKKEFKLVSNSGITSNDLIDAFFNLDSAYRKNACWLVSDDFMKGVYKLTDNDGRPLWLPALSAGGYDTILGKKVVYCSALDGFGANKIPAFFGDFSFYEIWDRSNMSFTRLNELYAQNDLIGIKVRLRLDAKLMDDLAVCKISCPA
ncbi:phage major capsid protein [Campylobacter estrildidarum]|uniref:Phage major capsid protein n=1 Tax=Campylobacter estrildidarum TaxID=2510189 RepID=A0A4U7BJP6_9BACT|nr:phage major capsid protein [Campylobacter estrildidarum]TKX30651.1 phage major capsid protein [Campylobacter estrildidarum]